VEIFGSREKEKTVTLFPDALSSAPQQLMSVMPLPALSRIKGIDANVGVGYDLISQEHFLNLWILLPPTMTIC